MSGEVKNARERIFRAVEGTEMTRSDQLFEDRYGPGSRSRLVAMFDQPCTTFAAIAAHFGVTRERVRQWHGTMYPGAPSGHERQRLCALQRSKRNLFRQPLFRSFYRHARAHVEPGRLTLMAGGDGFLSRSVRLDGHVVSIRGAALKHQGRHQQPTYGLSGGGAAVDYIYYRLSDEDFLFVPRAE